MVFTDFADNRLVLTENLSNLIAQHTGRESDPVDCLDTVRQTRQVLASKELRAAMNGEPQTKRSLQRCFEKKVGTEEELFVLLNARNFLKKSLFFCFLNFFVSLSKSNASYSHNNHR